MPVLNQPPPPTFHQTTSTIERKTQGFKFNYLPVDEPYHPDVFASRVGEHGSHHGHKYWLIDPKYKWIILIQGVFKFAVMIEKFGWKGCWCRNR